MDNARFQGIDRLYGAGSVERLSACHVCVVGVGGVGSWAVEALARSGIGTLTLIDADEVCLSNTNRQLPALDGNYGQAKTHVLAERARRINPDIVVHEVQRFLTPTTLHLLDGGFDLVLDACDAFRVKVEMTVWCRRHKLPVVVIGSAGGRTDPALVCIRDLSRTEHDAMLSLMRKKLRQEHGFSHNPKRHFGVPAVYSLENVQYPQADGSVCGRRPEQDGSMALGCEGGLGAATHVTATFAFVAVGRILQRLLR